MTDPLARMGFYFLLATVFLVGCGDRATIRRYQVQQPETAPTESQRMLAAIVPRQEKAWFFKLMGPAEQVQGVAKDFRQLVGSVQFDSQGEPTWTLPSGWNNEPGNAFRFATVRRDDLEIAVSSLSLPSGDLQEYLLRNINRWRGQLQLPPIGREAMQQQSESLSLPQDEQAVLVDLTGVAAAGGMNTAPFATPSPSPQGEVTGAAPSTRGEDAAPSTRGESAEGGLQYEVPPGWTPGRTGGFRQAAFVVQRDGQQIEVTVIPLGAAAGGLLQNVNRWREQLGLEEITADQLDELRQQIPVQGQARDYVQLDGTADPPQSILAVVIPEGDRTWFVKLMGDQQLAHDEKAHFEDFVQSLRIPTGT